jgi:uncharacterized protein YchJ
MCPCSSGLSYKDCCKKLHDSVVMTERFPDPVATTKARYTAFAIGRVRVRVRVRVKGLFFRLEL